MGLGTTAQNKTNAPAMGVVGADVVTDTSAAEGMQFGADTVQRSVIDGLPDSPLTTVLNALAFTNVPAPATTLHVPVPDVGFVAANVVLDAHAARA